MLKEEIQNWIEDELAKLRAFDETTPYNSGFKDGIEYQLDKLKDFIVPSPLKGERGGGYIYEQLHIKSKKSSDRQNRRCRVFR